MDIKNAEEKDQVLTLEEFKTLNCCKDFHDPDYQHPEPNEIRTLRSLMKWSQNDFARAVGAKVTKKGSPAVQKWERSKDSNQYRRIRPAVWKLALHQAGLLDITPEAYKEEPTAIEEQFIKLLKMSPSTKPFNDPTYKPPTPEEVQALRKIMKWSRNDLAKRVGIPTPRESTADVRTLENPEWRLALMLAGIN